MMFILLFFGIALGRIHDLKLKDDDRIIIDLSTFAYNSHGILHVTFDRFHISSESYKEALGNHTMNQLLTGTPQIGFILEKLNSRGNVKYKRDPDLIGGSRCNLHETPKNNSTRQVIKVGFQSNTSTQTIDSLSISCEDLSNQNIKTKITDNHGDEKVTRKSRSAEFTQIVQSKSVNNFNFSIDWEFGENADGLYELTFHNCLNLRHHLAMTNLELRLQEANYVNGEKHFLSSGDIPLPMVYGFCAGLFFLATIVWFAVLRQKNQTVYRIHYLMLVLVFFKALSVMFHSIDYKFLDIEGKTDTWTIIFYVVHLLKGGILIITLTLIGSGWAFIKYVLADKEKKIFLIVVPLQVFVNVAYIIFSETEEGEREYTNWSHIMITLDLLCYVIISCPVYWSIKHLEQSSQTDGKAARNLEKLDLFRNFYIMFVLYIYFTRIVVYILGITLPPYLTWVDDLSEEMATLVFFILTGYKFRPGCDNPYFKVEENDMAEVLTKTAITEKVQRRKDKGEKQMLLADSDDDENTILDTENIH